MRNAAHAGEDAAACPLLSLGHAPMNSTRSLAHAVVLALSATTTFACGGATDAGSGTPSASSGTSPATVATAGASVAPGGGSGAPADPPPVTPTTTTLDAGATPSAPVVDASPGYPPIDTSAMAACPTTAASSMYVLPFDVDGVTCVNFTPVDVGEPATGENASLAQYALRPATAAPQLVLFMIGSGGHPSGPLQAGAATNFYAAAVAAGHAVFAVSYKNAASIGSICHADDTCYFPTRESILLGTPEPGAKLTATLDESVVDRTARSLRYLAAGDPAGNWGSYLTTLDPSVPAAQAIDWTKIITAGHSQGGGHAAALGKLFPVARVVQLSSTCDNSDGSPASWTDGTSGTWASDPTMFYGFGAPSTLDPVTGAFDGDSTCPYHTENWTHLGLKKNHRNNFAEVCGETGDTHDASLKCPDNYPTWLSFLQ